MRARALVLLAIALACGAGCRRTPAAASGKRIVVLGIDAMDPAFLERHWDSLPNLRGLRASGDFRRLATTIPPQSPVAWSTFTTGMNPGGHGIFDFVHRDPATMAPLSSMADIEPPARTLPLGPYVLPLSSGRIRTFRRGRAFWQILADHGVPAVMVRMPNNFPPVECDARTLSGMGTPDLRGTYGTFTYFTDYPLAERQDVAGGRIVPVVLQGDRVTLTIEGPENTLRRDRARSTLLMTVARDPSQPAARFEIDGKRFLLRQGEWSGWIQVRFPIIPGLKSAAGMFRVFARQLQPEFDVYVSPVNIDPSEPELPISTPPSYSRSLAAAIGPFYTQGIAEDTAALRQGVLSREQYREQTRLVAGEQFALLHHALQEFSSGVLFFHFLGIDQDSHMLWGKHEDELLETYRRVDVEVGRVLERAGDATVMVISDHGFSTFDRAVNVNTWLYNEGFLALDSPDSIGAGEMFAHVDWSRTQAYALGLNGLYLNLAGREKNGIVKPADAPALIETIARRLEELRDPANGRVVAANVYRASAVYHGAAVRSAPDLILGWAAGYRASWQSALGVVAKDLVSDNQDEWRGDHCIAAELVPGVFLSNRRSRIPNPRLADLTVTLLREFGIPRPAEMEGRPIY
ncbi:MAG TPA: alkaline phosphatase family protein [Bryobacteraceae bacterium]|nr:alkaline phosphatase family protein [Bryobacteraceae bacterium]